MTKPCIICVAITGSLPRKAHNPAVPISIAEQVESAQETMEAGASIVHCHVRNDDETPTDLPPVWWTGLGRQALHVGR
jgi:3-keto-5-aminohexanoate cleavage enzyme